MFTVTVVEVVVAAGCLTTNNRLALLFLAALKMQPNIVRIIIQEKKFSTPLVLEE